MGKKNGRPSVMTKTVILQIEQAFAMGSTDKEACSFAGVSQTTLRSYEKKYPWVLEKKEQLKAEVVLKARATILKAIEAGDVKTARWFLDKVDGRAKQNVELSTTVLSHEDNLLLLRNET